MKIVFANRYYWPDESATSQMLSDLAPALAKHKNVELIVLTSNQLYTDASAQLLKSETHLKVRIQRLGSTRFGRNNLLGRAIDYLTFYASAFKALRQESHSADWIICKTDPPMLHVIGTAAKARSSKAKIIAWNQDVFPEIAFAAKNGTGLTSLIQKLLCGIRNRSLQRCDHVVVLGEDMQAHFEENGIPPEKLKVLPNWADGTLIRPMPAKENPLRQAWEIDKDFVVGYSGNLGRVHDYQTMLKAACDEALPAQTRFLMIGSGALQKKLREEIPAIARSRFIFQPYQPRDALRASLTAPDAHWFSLQPACNALVFPSKFYGILAAGRPCIFIGDPRSRLADFIRDYHIGYVVSPGDVASCLEAIRQLRDSPEKRAAMGRRAREVFERDLQFETTADRWRRLLKIEQRVQNNRPHPSPSTNSER